MQLIQDIKDAIHAAESTAEKAVALIHSLIGGAQTALDNEDMDALNDILVTARQTADELGAAVAVPATVAAAPASDPNPSTPTVAADASEPTPEAEPTPAV